MKFPVLQRLPASFYSRPTLEVAKNLLGKVLVRGIGQESKAGRIVEVEAYIGEKDPACHAFHGLTPRTRVMYGPPGFAYVYFTYGIHYMLNVVTEKEGYPAAILIRALEPLTPFSGDDPRPLSGPGKLCRNMNIDKRHNGISLQSEELWIGQEPRFRPPWPIRWSPRIGISAGQEHLWRAYFFGNKYVTRKSNKTDATIPVPVINHK